MHFILCSFPIYPRLIFLASIGNHGHGTTGLNTGTGLNAGAHGAHGTHGTTGGAYENQTGLDPIHNNNNVAGAVPSSALPGSASHTHPANQSTGSKELVGKIEVAAGKVLHSAKLVQKGEIKLEQAQQIKVQGAELNEAERLENEAGLRRERAVNHGADAGHLGRPHHAGAGPGAGGNDLGPGAAAGGNVNSRGAGLY